MRSRQVPHRPSKRLLEFDPGWFFFEPKDEGKKNKTFIEEEIKAAKMLIEETEVIQPDTGILIR